MQKRTGDNKMVKTSIPATISGDAVKIIKQVQKEMKIKRGLSKDPSLTQVIIELNVRANKVKKHNKQIKEQSFPKI